MRIGVIGAGRMGQKRIADLLALGEDDLIVYDCNPTAAKALGEQYGIEWRSSTDADEFLWNWQPDAVLICTPPHSHLDWLWDAYNHGVRAMFVEKPLALTLPDCDYSDCVTMVGCNWRFASLFRSLRYWVEGNQPGPLAGGTFHAFYPLMEVRPDYLSTYVAQTGVLLDVGSHMMDLALDWFGPATLDADYPPVILPAASIGLPCIDGEATVCLRHGSGQYSKIVVSFLRRYQVGVSISGTGWFVAYEHVQSPGPEMFIQEMRTFLAAVRGETESPNPISRATATLRLLLEARARWRAT